MNNRKWTDAGWDGPREDDKLYPVNLRFAHEFMWRCSDDMARYGLPEAYQAALACGETWPTLRDLWVIKFCCLPPLSVPYMSIVEIAEAIERGEVKPVEETRRVRP